MIKKLQKIPHKILPKLIGYRLYPSPITPITTYKKLYGTQAVKKRQFYNVGAGQFRHEAWTNIDHYSDHYKRNPIDIDYDLTQNKPLPLPSDSAQLFYTSHTIEHINDKNVKNLFKEVYRVLKKGGLFRVTCPNVDLDYLAYQNKDIQFFKSKRNAKASIPQHFLITIAGQLSPHHKAKVKKFNDKEIIEILKKKKLSEACDYFTKRVDMKYQNQDPGSHVNWWNPEKLTKYLKAAGFKTVYLSGFGQSTSPVMRDTNHFDNTRPNISLYMEAKK